MAFTRTMREIAVLEAQLRAPKSVAESMAIARAALKRPLVEKLTSCQHLATISSTAEGSAYREAVRYYSRLVYHPPSGRTVWAGHDGVKDGINQS